MGVSLLPLSRGSEELVSKSVPSLRSAFGYPRGMEKWPSQPRAWHLPLQLVVLSFGFKPQSEPVDSKTRTVV